MYRLVFLNGRMKGRRVAVQQGTVLIGRDAHCHIDLSDDDEVSHQHACIEQRRDGIYIKDLGALNPILVNGRAAKEAKLAQGDRIEIGRTQLQFQLIEGGATGTRRRLGKVQAFTLAAVVIILLLEGAFMFFFNAWQTSELPQPGPAPVTGTVEVAVLAPTSQPGGVAALAVTTEPGAVAGEVASDAEGDVSTEMAELREQLAMLRQQITNLSATGEEPAPVVPPAVTSAAPAVAGSSGLVAEAVAAAAQAKPEPPPVRVEEEDPLIAKAKELLAAARVEVERGDLVRADQILAQVQIMAPEFVPAYFERAAVAEKRGNLVKAGVFWEEIMKRSAGTPLYERAAAERQRLAQAELTRKTVAGPTPAVAKTAAKMPRRIRVVEVDREKFQGTDEYEEMRVVRISLKTRPSDQDFEPDEVQVLVTFYDRSLDTQDVMPTRVTVPESALRVEEAWAPGEVKTVSAAYVVPSAFRSGEEAELGDRRVYEGFRVQVFYKGELQDEAAQPRTLLKLPAPALPVTS